MAGSARCLTPTSFFSYMAEQGPALLYPRLAMVRLTTVHGFDPHLAERYLQEAEILSPRSPHVRKLGKLLARHHISEGLYDEAIGFLDWAMEVIGEEAEIFGLKAAALAYSGELEDAARVCQQAMDLDPTNTTYQTLAAQIAANSPVAGESASESSNRPIVAMVTEPHSMPMGAIRCAIGPAKWRSTNIIPLT